MVAASLGAARPRAAPAARARRNGDASVGARTAARARATATRATKGETVAAKLKGVSVVVVGDDADANEAVARALATRLAYAPVSVPALLESTRARGAEEGMTVDDDDELSEDAKALVLENSAHEQLATFLRVCVATCGGGRGATARGDCWTWLFGAITVWVDAEGADESAPQRQAYELSEVRVVVKKGVAVDGEAAADQVLAGIDALVDADDQLCGKKNLYVRFGCRGDWPDLKPPGEYAGDAVAAPT